MIVNPDKTETDKTESISYSRTATIDTVTGAVKSYGDWTPKDSNKNSFSKIEVPAIEGYTPTETEVAAQTPTNDRHYSEILTRPIQYQQRFNASLLVT